MPTSPRFPADQMCSPRADVGIGPYKGKIPYKCKKHGPPAAFSATRKEEKKMKKDDLFIYMIPGRCEEKKW